MMNVDRVVLLSCVALLSHGRARAQQQSHPPITAFTDVAVIPMDRERVLEHQTVLVQGDRITELGPSDRVKVPAGAVQIDGRGKYLLPGFGDMHVHIGSTGGSARQLPDDMPRDEWAARTLFLYLANGVTTVRDMGSDSLQWRWRDEIARGTLLGPRLYTAGVPDYSSPVAAARSVEALKAAGYDAVKFYADTAVYDSIVTAAHRVSLDVVGHPPPNRDFRAVLADRWRSIEHLTGYYEYAMGLSGRWSLQGWFLMDHRRLIDTAAWMQPAFDARPAIRELVDATVRARTWNCPTLAMVADWATVPDSVAIEEVARRHAAADSATRAEVREVEAAWNQSGFRQTSHRLLELGFQLTKALHDAGAGIVLGTDAGPGSGVDMPAGFLLRAELEALVQAGLTPYQALETTTRNVAEFLGTLDSTGTVAAGKRADLVLLGGNPLRDIRYTAGSAGVMVGGRWLSRAAIDAQLDAWRIYPTTWRTYDLTEVRRQVWVP